MPSPSSCSCHGSLPWLMDPLPLAQPSWSTTAPSVHPIAPSPTVESAPIQVWGEDQSAWAWWLGFLHTLDLKGDMNPSMDEPCTYMGDDLGMGALFGLPRVSIEAKEGAIDAHDISPDEWLMMGPEQDQD
ncbi:hypothetical protein AMTR_s00023p00128160 [Amborella trichopoda]|uniref:Uncharacterized protein n=1 Tax=Amborella trichopoda TaxID=13333 RepID=W1NK37_AMBTC|nr:hypothetical protein AMTR_s00023p00128160 [Amborella trichopoda]